MTMTSASLTLWAARQPFYAIRSAIVSALRSARRSWALARARERRAALELATWEQLRDLDERMLDDIGLKPGDLPWMAERDAFARFADDATAWKNAFGLSTHPNWR